MRRIAIVFAAAALIACGQPPSNASADSAPPPPRMDDILDGDQGGGGPALETQADFVARCTREMIAANPQSRQWAGSQCEQEWEKVLASRPLADAMLAAVPAPGETVAPAAIRARTPSVQWRARPEGALIAQGRLGQADVNVDSNGLTFAWAETGALIPFDLVQALRERGAEVTMVGCSQLGTGEFSTYHRVVAAGRAPFGLMVYERTAPTANASSFYSAVANVSGQISTLASLRRDGSEWSATCPY